MTLARFFILAWIFCLPLGAADDCQSALARMPVRTNSFNAHLTVPVELIFDSFKPTETLRSVVLMPGAADQLYFFNSGRLFLPEKPSLLDVLRALTNHAQLRYTCVPPFLLVHTKLDNLADPVIFAPGADTQRLKSVKFDGASRYLDRPYDRVLPDLEPKLGLQFLPDQTSTKSWHFYRVSLIGYDLSAPELLRAMAYSMRTTVQLDPKNALFADRPFLDR